MPKVDLGSACEWNKYYALETTLFLAGMSSFYIYNKYIDDFY